METVNNIASAASRAIWGTTEEDPSKKTGTTTTDNETKGTEPLSGELGDVKAGEPYDRGNEDTTTSSADPIKSTEKTLPSHPKITAGDIPGNTPSTALLSSTTEPTTNASLDEKPSFSNTTSGPGAEPSISALPTSTTPSTTHQGADKPSAIPTSSSDTGAIKATKREAEEAQVDVKGDGPKTLEEKSKIGGAGVGAGNAEKGELQNESRGEGTGEKYVKSSGVMADGGDFDASQPGAGREADRLLESKGIKHDTPGATSKKEEVTPTSSASKIESTTSKERKSESSSDKGVGTPEGKEKRSLKEKIKAKLHKH